MTRRYLIVLYAIWVLFLGLVVGLSIGVAVGEHAEPRATSAALSKRLLSTNDLAGSKELPLTDSYPWREGPDVPCGNRPAARADQLSASGTVVLGIDTVRVHETLLVFKNAVDARASFAAAQRLSHCSTWRQYGADYNVIQRVDRDGLLSVQMYAGQQRVQRTLILNTNAIVVLTVIADAHRIHSEVPRAEREAAIRAVAPAERPGQAEWIRWRALLLIALALGAFAPVVYPAVWAVVVTLVLVSAYARAFHGPPVISVRDLVAVLGGALLAAALTVMGQHIAVLRKLAQKPIALVERDALLEAAQPGAEIDLLRAAETHLTTAGFAVDGYNFGLVLPTRGTLWFWLDSDGTTMAQIMLARHTLARAEFFSSFDGGSLRLHSSWAARVPLPAGWQRQCLPHAEPATLLRAHYEALGVLRDQGAVVDAIAETAAPAAARAWLRAESAPFAERPLRTELRFAGRRLRGQHIDLGTIKERSTAPASPVKRGDRGSSK